MMHESKIHVSFGLKIARPSVNSPSCSSILAGSIFLLFCLFDTPAIIIWIERRASKAYKAMPIKPGRPKLLSDLGYAWFISFELQRYMKNIRGNNTMSKENHVEERWINDT